MASATEQTLDSGATRVAIRVENPATGKMLKTVPVLGAGELDGLAERGRRAQPDWAAIGFEGRGRVLRRAQKWMLDNADRILDVVVSESGKTHEDAQLADFGYTVSALGFWAKHAPRYLADERVPSWNNPIAFGKKLVIRYAPVGLVGVIGPWNYPIANSFGDCHPRPRRGQQRDRQAERGHAAELAADGGDDAGVRAARARLPGRHRRRLDRRRVDRAGRLRDVHRIHSHGKVRHEGGRRRAHPVLSRARRQGPDDRLCRRRRRARGQCRRVLLDEQRRPGVHLGRARLRRGRRLRRVRAARGRQRTPAAPGGAGRTRAPSTSGRSPSPRSSRSSRTTFATRSPRAPRFWWAAMRARAPAASTSRPCSSTSTTR